MKQDLSKICADSLRTFTKENYDIKLKAAHAHELVAAYFGYKSKSAMLADTKYPISNLDKAEIIVMRPDKVIDERRSKLQELSPDLPDSYTLGEAVFVPLFSDEWWSSEFPPFNGFDKAAKVLVESNAAFQSTFKNLTNLPMHHVVAVDDSKNEVTLHVFHMYGSPTEDTPVYGQTLITLPRVAGHIGFGAPQFRNERWGPGFRRPLKSLGVTL